MASSRGDGLGERLARRASGTTSGRRRPGATRVERLAPRLGLHHHAGAAAVRGVVDGAVPVVGPVAQVVDGDVEQPVVARLAGAARASSGSK